MYLGSTYRDRCDRLAFMTYVTDALRLNAKGQYIDRRWWDIVRPKEVVSVEETVRDVVAKGGIEIT